jgi:hypothetical protein
VVGFGEDEVFHGVNVGQARFELCRCVRRDSVQTGHMTTTCGTEDNNLLGSTAQTSQKIAKNRAVEAAG